MRQKTAKIRSQISSKPEPITSDFREIQERPVLRGEILEDIETLRDCDN